MIQSAFPWLSALLPADGLRIEQLCTHFEEALQKGEVPDRDSFRRQVPETLWPALLQELAALEEAYRPRDANSPEAQPPCSATHPSTAAQPTLRIGPYKLLRPIGEGGMGTVWMAEQTEPVKRLVALKLIKPGLNSSQILARFEAERQAIALMDHPNIARVLDARTIEPIADLRLNNAECKSEISDSQSENTDPQSAISPGQPYFVMELVKGTPVTAYCDTHHLTPRQRLELFVPVCQAIQHAHHKGIIHRDIKPSNVLVATVDGKPVPKVIDFGLAKAVGQRLTERTLFTGLGGIVGTLEYMSPEQAAFDANDIDTRSDVYSLGVLLYELLTGTTPLTHQRLESATLPEALRLIREEEPPTPSTRIGGKNPAGAESAGSPVKLAKLVRGELDWVVMKALEKDRDRRYETANAMALDIQRVLRDEPVLAGPPSTIYRLRKFAKRHMRPLAAATALLLALIGGTVGTTVGLVQAQDQRDAALLSARQARQAEAEAEKAVDFLKDFVLAAARPKGQQGGLGHDATIRAAIDAAEPEIGNRFSASPLAEAAVRHSLGSTYLYLGQSKPALRQLERSVDLRRTSLGSDHAATLASMNGLALAYQSAGRLRDSVQLFQETLKRCDASLGPDDPATITAMTNLAVAYQVAGRFREAIPIFEDSLHRRKSVLGADHPDTINSMHNLAGAYRDAGQLQDAAQSFEANVKQSKAKLGNEHPDTLSGMNALAGVYHALGKFKEAIDLQEETLSLRTKVLGSDHPGTRTTINNLAQSYHDAGRVQDALKLFEKSLEIDFAAQGIDHPDTLTGFHNLASAYQAGGRLNDALPLFESTLRMRTATLGKEHPDTLQSMSGLAGAYQAANRLPDALPLWDATVKLRQASLGDNHPDTLHAMNNLAGAYQSGGQNKKAYALFEATLKRRQATLGNDHPDTLISMNNLALAMHYDGRPSDALSMWEMALKLHRSNLGNDHPNTLHVMNNLAGAYQAAGRWDDAEPMFHAAADGARLKLGPSHPKTQLYIANLGRCQDSARKAKKGA